MSERRTADIKFRCTPTFKAAVQAQAEAEGIPASQLIENAVQNHLLQKHLYLALNEARDEPQPTQDEREPSDFYGGPDFDAAGVADIAVPVATHEFVHGGTTSQGGFLNPVANAPQVEAQAATAPCNCRAWEFCTHKAKA